MVLPRNFLKGLKSFLNTLQAVVIRKHVLQRYLFIDNSLSSPLVRFLTFPLTLSLHNKPLIHTLFFPYDLLRPSCVSKLPISRMPLSSQFQASLSKFSRPID